MKNSDLERLRKPPSNTVTLLEIPTKLDGATAAQLLADSRSNSYSGGIDINRYGPYVDNHDIIVYLPER